MILLTKERKFVEIKFKVQGAKIAPGVCLKEVLLDTKVTFKQHIRQTIAKAGKK